MRKITVLDRQTCNKWFHQVNEWLKNNVALNAVWFSKKSPSTPQIAFSENWTMLTLHTSKMTFDKEFATARDLKDNWHETFFLKDSFVSNMNWVGSFWWLHDKKFWGYAKLILCRFWSVVTYSDHCLHSDEELNSKWANLRYFALINPLGPSDVVWRGAFWCTAVSGDNWTSTRWWRRSD